jgi:transcriptional regulator with XRE-family HTH domain
MNADDARSVASGSGVTNGVVVNGRELRRRLHRLGGSTVELADRARVARGTVSRALNGRPIQPSKLRAIAAALDAWPPIPSAEALIDQVAPGAEQ